MTIKELVFVDNLDGVWFADVGRFGQYKITKFLDFGEFVGYHCSFVDKSTNVSQSIPIEFRFFRFFQWASRACQAHYENLVEQHLDVPPEVSRDCPACHAAAVRKVNHCGNCNRVSEIE